MGKKEDNKIYLINKKPEEVLANNKVKRILFELDDTDQRRVISAIISKQLQVRDVIYSWAVNQPGNPQDYRTKFVASITNGCTRGEADEELGIKIQFQSPNEVLSSTKILPILNRLSEYNRERVINEIKKKELQVNDILLLWALSKNGSNAPELNFVVSVLHFPSNKIKYRI